MFSHHGSETVCLLVLKTSGSAVCCPNPDGGGKDDRRSASASSGACSVSSRIDATGGRRLCSYAAGGASTAGAPNRSGDDAMTSANPNYVLIVEDEPIIRIDLADFLTDAGFQVLEAGDADEAIDLLEQQDRIDIIITDLDMPGSMDGLKLARAVFDRWPPIRIIVVSGHRRVEITDIPDGGVFFSKPFSQPALLSSMHEMLSSIRATTS